MIHESAMETYEARLESFGVGYPLLKKKGSHSKGTKSVKWSHKSPSPAQLAEAGFFYHPTDGSPDNTTCFLCHSNLDGWEAGDDAVVEHLKHAPECGWAINVAIELEREDACDVLANPSAEYLLRARTMTFGSSWPHENKRGWTCKIRKMATSGWFYCPTSESDDYVKCAYCHLGMDGWEPKDDPYLAHHQRSSDCKFFALSVPAKQKSGRPKKGRASKASRTSSQSISTAVSEGGSITETEINEASLLAMPLVECEQSTEITRGKKSGKSRRPPTKAKAKALNTTLTEPAKSTSYNEPEDEDFEVKIEKAPARKENTYKRKSDEMEDGGIYGPNQMISDPDMNPPPPKRRTTRASNSILTAEKTSNKPMTNGHGHEMDIDDVQETASAPVSTLKKGFQKGAKKGRNEMSSAVRKASAISTAAGVSSGDIIPSDDALDAALEADLDRPLTDEEVEAGQPDIVYPRMRRLTRTRPGSRDGPPSLALERRTTRLSSQPFQASGFGQQDLLHQVASRVVEEAARSASRLTTENVLPNDLPDDTSAADANDAFVQPKTKQTKSKKSTKSRPASHQLSKKHAQPLIPSPAAGPPSSSENLVTLNHGSQVVEDESGNETDVSVVTKSLVKKGGPKGKQGKNAPLLSPMQKKVTRRELKEGSSCLESVFVATAVNPPKDALTIISSHDIQMASPNKEKYPELLEATTSRSGTFLDPLGSIKSVEGGERQTPVRSSIAVQPVDQATNIPHLSESERESTPLQALPVAENSARDSSVQTTPRPAPSPQSSDVENQPPSSRPSMVRPPLLVSSPPKSQIIRIPLVATPTASPSKRNNSRLKSTMPWSAIDYDKIFLGSPAEKENDPFNLKLATTGEIVSLTSPEKKLSLEEWVQLNARRGEEHLRSECERVIGKFEGEGVRALKTLEGITCVD